MLFNSFFPGESHQVVKIPVPYPAYYSLTAHIQEHELPFRARIFKLLRGPTIESKEPILPGCVAWWAGTTTLFLLGSQPP